jgi:hypothetical protein
MSDIRWAISFVEADNKNSSTGVGQVRSVFLAFQEKQQPDAFGFVFSNVAHGQGIANLLDISGSVMGKYVPLTKHREYTRQRPFHGAVVITEWLTSHHRLSASFCYEKTHGQSATRFLATSHSDFLAKKQSSN